MDSETCKHVFTPITSTASTAEFKPPTINDLWDGHCYSVPWPGNVYNIIEKSSNRAMAIDERGYIYLRDINNDDDSKSPLYRWLCVEKNGYYAFVNVHTGQYMRHDENLRLRTWTQDDVGPGESMTPRKSPDGGYELLQPYDLITLRRVCVHQDGSSLQLRRYGITLWEFLKV